LLLRNKKVIAEFCKKPYEVDDLRLLFSLTKSFTSIGVGIAYDKGLLDLDDYVISFFPDKLPSVISSNLKKMKIKHLLSMTCGIQENTYSILYPQKDWVQAFLAQDFPHEPGTYYRYSTHASHMLSAIVERITKKSFLKFMNDNLFNPLNISKVTWEVGPSGITAGGMGLSSTIEAVAKFGQLLLDKGVFNRQRIVSDEYIELASTNQIKNYSNKDKIHEVGYGYQIKIAERGCFFAAGAFGQLCFVAPAYNIVIALTSRTKNNSSVINLIYEKILDSVSNKSDTLPDHIKESERLKKKLTKLQCSVPLFRDVPEGIPLLNVTGYIIEENPHGLGKIIFQRNGDNLKLKLKYHAREDSELKFNFKQIESGEDFFVKDIQYHKQKYISYSVWECSDSLVLTIFYIETPYVVTYRIKFYRNRINVSFRMNSSLNLKDFEVVGHLIKNLDDI
ncbi:MAG: serine hydrolase domain-containing protein, partial [bacterium]